MNGVKLRSDLYERRIPLRPVPVILGAPRGTEKAAEVVLVGRHLHSLDARVAPGCRMELVRLYGRDAAILDADRVSAKRFERPDPACCSEGPELDGTDLATVLSPRVCSSCRSKTGLFGSRNSHPMGTRR